VVPVDETVITPALCLLLDREEAMSVSGNRLVKETEREIVSMRNGVVKSYERKRGR
jgi:hypothetical protein